MANDCDVDTVGYWFARYTSQGAMVKEPMGKEKEQLLDWQERCSHGNRMRIQHRVPLDEIATRMQRPVSSDLDDSALAPHRAEGR